MALMRINNFVLTVAFCLSLMAGFTSCTHDPVILNELNPVCFDSVVFPILLNFCGKTGCHDGFSSEAGNFEATSYESIIKSVKPFNARKSQLYKAITDFNGENMMPPDRPLTQQQRTIIEVWIEQGAVNTKCSLDTNPPINPDSICFKQDILPVFINSCAIDNCHNGISQGGEDELYALNSYATIRPHVVPNNPGASIVYEVVTVGGENAMPMSPIPPLTDSQKELLRKWIAEGAIDSDCPNSNCDTTGTIGYSAQIKPIMDNSCVTCHNATVSKGGVNLDGYSNVQTFASTLRNGTPILVGVVNQLSGFIAMPQGSKLDNCTIRKIELWIQQGMLNI
jgi:hypothetical protein